MLDRPVVQFGLAKPPEERIEDFLAIDPMEMEIGVGLIRLADPNRGGDLLPRITAVRQSVASEIGKGSTFKLKIKLPVGKLSMLYRVIGWEPGRQVVLEGLCPWFTVTDTITLKRIKGGTKLTPAAWSRIFPEWGTRKMMASWDHARDASVVALRVAREPSFLRPLRLPAGLAAGGDPALARR